MDRGFQDISEAIAEQRRYTEFAFERLRDEVHDGFGRMEHRFAENDGRFAQIDGRFAQIDGRFERLEAALSIGFGRLDRVARKLERVDRIARKLDRLIDAHSGARKRGRPRKRRRSG
jgi:hypothetical protein